jgi:hypothetical protein
VDEMKSIRIAILLAATLLVGGAQADTLTLTDPLSIPVPPETHADAYDFPTQLLDLSNPIISLAINYDGTQGSSRHQIVSANLLFDPNVTYIETLLQTPFRYEARATFSIPVTDVSNAWSPGFLAVHENTMSLTSLTWTATYSDGTQRVAIDGIIPEPSSAVLIAVIGGFGLFVRRRFMV